METVLRLLGARIHQLREERRRKMPELAQEVGQNRSTLYAIERGTAAPSMRLVAALTRALGVEHMDFFCWPGVHARHDLLDACRFATVADVEATRAFVIARYTRKAPVPFAPPFAPTLSPPEHRPLLGARLKQLRLENELSVPDLTALTGQSAPSLYQIERGADHTSVAALSQLAMVLGVDEVDLYCWPGAHARHDLFEATRGAPLAVVAGAREFLRERLPRSEAATKKTKARRRRGGAS